MQSNKKTLNVPYFAFEAVQARNERALKRLWILCAISAVVVAIESISLFVQRDK